MKISVIALVTLCAISLSARITAWDVQAGHPGDGDWRYAPSGFDHKRRHNSFSIRTTFIYAFNHDEAARSFQKAAEVDPKLAMAYWESPRLSDPTTTIRSEIVQAGHEAIQKGSDLSASASPSEKATSRHGSALSG